jgi:hypothetical protein
MPGPVKSMYTAPYGVFAIEDYEAKYYTLLRLAAGQDISCIATVNPSRRPAAAGAGLAQAGRDRLLEGRDGRRLPGQVRRPVPARGSTAMT